MAEALRVSVPYNFCSCQVRTSNNFPSGSYSSFVLLNWSIFVFVFEITFLDKERSQNDSPETCSLWTCGLLVLKHLKLLGWKLLQLSSGKRCTETPALLLRIQTLTTCGLSEAISYGRCKPWPIYFSFFCTWLLSVVTSHLRLSGFHPHQSKVFPN